MTANVQPVYSRIGDVQWSTIVTNGSTTKDGTSGTTTTIFTADATNGGFIQRVRFKSAGTNVVSVARLFVNNGSSTAVAANNAMIAELTLPAITNSEIAAQPDLDIAINFALPPAYVLFFTIGTSVAAGWIATGIGGKY